MNVLAPVLCVLYILLLLHMLSLMGLAHSLASYFYKNPYLPDCASPNEIESALRATHELDRYCLHCHRLANSLGLSFLEALSYSEELHYKGSASIQDNSWYSKRYVENRPCWLCYSTSHCTKCCAASGNALEPCPVHPATPNKSGRPLSHSHGPCCCPNIYSLDPLVYRPLPPTASRRRVSRHAALKTNLN